MTGPGAVRVRVGEMHVRTGPEANTRTIMANPDHDPRTGAPPREVHVEPAEKKSNWLLWLVPLLLLLGLLFALSQCGERESEPVQPVENVATAQPIEDPVTPATGVAAPAAASGLAAYLAGTEPLPRTFVFERVNFDSGSSEVRPADREEVTTIASALRQHPNARIRLVGFADARGDAGNNAQLGGARAESVKAALVAEGIDAGRIETGTGGEAGAIADNASAQGQAENRRTELVVLQR